MRRLIQRVYHLLERIIRESKVFPQRLKVFGWKVAFDTFLDGLIPPGKSERYIHIIESYVDEYLRDLIKEYQQKAKNWNQSACKFAEVERMPVWCCWWQGEKNMPELVAMCYERLKQVIPKDRAELHLITLDNYLSYVELPKHIIQKFENGTITMTTMSDVLRFNLLSKYGGYWLDATVFFTGEIPKEYFSEEFYCQRMADPVKCKREACKGNWCGFSMAGKSDNIIFHFMKDAFSSWWKDYDTIVDYVLIDYMLLSGYKSIPEIKDIINGVPNNNEDIFEMYQVLNQPYSDELWEKLTKRNVMHKFTYKMDLHKETADGEQTLYGYLWNMVYEI